MKAAPELLEKVSSLESELDVINKQIKSQKTQIRILEEQLCLSCQKQFGASSKEISPQQNFFSETEEVVKEEQTGKNTESVEMPAHTHKKKKRVSIPENIKREEIIHDLPESEKVCPHDGTALKCIDEESHEQLDIILAKIKALRNIL